jgi:hypothetical protein
MKSYDVIGYAIAADLYCTACAESWAHKAGVDLDNPEECAFYDAAPVFADECGDCALFCSGCNSQIW